MTCREEQQKKPSHMVDLDTLAFPRGSHYMANQKCSLPQGSFRVQKQGYEDLVCGRDQNWGDIH